MQKVAGAPERLGLGARARLQVSVQHVGRVNVLEASKQLRGSGKGRRGAEPARGGSSARPGGTGEAGGRPREAAGGERAW